MKLDKIYAMHAPKIQVCVCVFPEKNASGKIIDNRVLGGTLKSMNIENLGHVEISCQYVESVKIFKYAYEHIPCVNSEYRAI